MNTAFDTFQLSFFLTLLFAVVLGASLVLKFWLASRQIRHVVQHRGAVPAAWADSISLAEHQKAAAYTVAQVRLGLLELAFGSAVLLCWTLFGGLHLLNQTLLAWMGPGLLQQLALLGCFTVIGTLIDLPFSLYRTFVLEQRFGFNKQTPGLWVKDLLMSSALGCAIGLPLAALVLWVMGATGSWWWLWTWGVWLAFAMLANLVYPTWIAPLFNTFKPLEDATVVERVSRLMQRSGFVSKGFYVMDGSRRSGHSNAYFTGFGKAKRVVFYDTLLASLSPGEVDAVLAHELGHFRHRHLRKRLIPLFGSALAALALLGWLSHQTWFYTGLGVLPSLVSANDALALLLFMMVLPVFGSFTTPLFARFSRQHEFEADAWAVQLTNGKDLASALLKLYKTNASTLTPDPVYARFYYSHPPAPERLTHIQEAMQHA